MLTGFVRNGNLLCFICAVFWLPVSHGDCPSDTELLRRLGNTRFYIVHGNERGNFVTFEEGLETCKQYGLIMAKIKDMATMAMVGRELEAIVVQNRLQDTWYWLDAAYNSDEETYEWGGEEGDVKYSNFFFRDPRPTGIGAFMSFLGVYNENEDVKQCLALALPWPGIGDPRGVIYGHNTIIDEVPCESKQKRHVLCESEDPSCRRIATDPYTISADRKTYFDDGLWIFGDRRYLVNWKHRRNDESLSYCEDLGLELYVKEYSDEDVLLHYLKMWTRGVTTSQYWTSDVYYGEDNSEDTMRRSARNKFERTFCIAMILSYEFPSQMPCEDPQNPDCVWSSLNFIPANCNNYLATICQHENKESRKEDWKEEYFSDVNKAIIETALTQEFGYEGNRAVLRSKYKQTFGVLHCPEGYRMLRATNVNWFQKSSLRNRDSAKVYAYDFKETYWVVDDEKFEKTADSECTVSEPDPPDGEGHARALKKVKCTDWYFYACEKHSNASMPFTGGSSPASPKMEWKEGPQPRTFPLVEQK